MDKMLSEGATRDNLFSSLGRMEGMMASLVAQHSELNRLVMSHNDRLSKLENYKSYLLGASMVVGAVSAFIFRHL
jgi:hypothetical protein